MACFFLSLSLSLSFIIYLKQILFAHSHGTLSTEEAPKPKRAGVVNNFVLNVNSKYL
jgi:hypothetical protein